MALESIEGAGKYISDLDENNPLSSDPPGTDGDNHLRGIKNTIKNTFPNVNGEVSATQTQLDYVVVGTLGTSEASKAVTADASGDVILSGNATISDGANDVDIASHDGTNGLKLGGVLVTTSAAELNYVDDVTSNIQTQIDTSVSFRGFRARASNLAMTASTNTTINSVNISTLSETNDTNGWFDLSAGTFTPNVAGFYQLAIVARCDNLSVSTYNPAVQISAPDMFDAISSFAVDVITGYSNANLSTLSYFNGSTDSCSFIISPGGDAAWDISYILVSAYFIGT